jgi:hypothetical protein
MRDEWIRSGFPLSKANEACGLGGAATRKYLTLDHLWYLATPDMYQKMQKYANRSKKKDSVLFSIDGKSPLTAKECSIRELNQQNII